MKNKIIKFVLVATIIEFFILLAVVSVVWFKTNDSTPQLDKDVSFGDTVDLVTDTEKGLKENIVDIEVKNDKAYLYIDAYFETCDLQIQPKISMYEEESWITVDQKLPLHESFFLDGEYHEYGGPYPMCDMFAYVKIKSPVEVSLQKFTYEKVGTRKDPNNQAVDIKDFVTKDYVGNIKIELEYCPKNIYLEYCNETECNYPENCKEVYTAILNTNGEIVSTETTTKP